MKYVLITPRSACKTMVPGPDVDRYLASGSYLRASEKARSKMTPRMRALRAKRRAEGWSNLNLWIHPDDMEVVRAVMQPGEDYAGLLIRLARKQSLY